jgi:excisionase family DNA binding protein
MALLTVQETAKVLRVSPITVRRYIAAGRLPAVKVGKGIRVREESLEKVMRPIGSNGSPIASERPVKRKKRTPAAQALLNLAEIGRLAAASEGPTDVSANKHKYLAEAYVAKIDRHA